MLDNMISLTDEKGREALFEFLDLIEYNDEEYVVLLPMEEPDDEGIVFIFRVDSSEKDAGESYIGVEDERELQAVFEIFREKSKDKFTFTE